MENKITERDWLLEKMQESLNEAYSDYLKGINNDVRASLSSRQTLEIVLALLRPKLGLPHADLKQEL